MKQNLFSMCGGGALLALTLFAGCGGGDNAVTPSPVTSVTRTYNNLQFTASVPKTTYRIGESVPVTLTVKNVGTQATHLNALDGVALAIGSARQNGTKISSFSNPPAGITFGLDTILAPGQEYTPTSAIWNQKKDATGTQVAAGQYDLMTWFNIITVNQVYVSQTDAEANLTTNPITITIL